MHSTKRKTTEQFIENAKKKHGNKYDYSKVDYINTRTKVCIICPEHGEFWQTPHYHLDGCGCPSCGLKRIAEYGRKRSGIPKKSSVPKRQHFQPNMDYINRNIDSTEEFVEYCTKLHNGKYDYSDTVFNGKNKKVIIICPEHGKFEQTAIKHLEGHGCKKCALKKIQESKKFTNEEIISKCIEKYGNLYDYSEFHYINMRTKSKIICPKHGEFWQTPCSHLLGVCGCKQCDNERKRNLFASTKEEFSSRASKIFNGKYSYDNVVYINTSTKVAITCPKHGDFMCTPAAHLKGSGCPICNAETLVYEERLYYFLKTIFNENDIIRQYRSNFLTNRKSLDFFIPRYKLAIEHQGKQHYYMTKFDKGDWEKLERRKNNDLIKYKECEENGIKILYFTYEFQRQPKNAPHKLYFKEEDLLNEINKLIQK